MSHKLHRMLSSLYNTPHLADNSTFEFATAFLKERNKVGMMVLPEDDGEDNESPDDLDDFDPQMGVGVINIFGALTYKPMFGMCGEVGCSYEGLLDQAEDMIEAGAKMIILNIDSGGGQGYGAFECANELRKMCDDAGVKIYAYNDGCCASAAYALACIADVVIANPYAETGSIGVLVSLLNDSKYLEQEGYTRTFITAGDSKVPFAADGSWREGFLEDIQAKVDSLYQDFVDHVSNYTGLTAQAIKDTQAKTYMAEDALALGLINKIQTRSEFFSYILTEYKGLGNA